MQMKDLFKKDPVHVKLRRSDVNWIIGGGTITRRRIMFVVCILRQIQEKEHCCEITYDQLSKLIQISASTTQKQAHNLDADGMLFLSESMRYYAADKFKYGDILMGIKYPIKFVAGYSDIEEFEFEGVINERNIMDIYKRFLSTCIYDRRRFIVDYDKDMHWKEESDLDDNY